MNKYAEYERIKADLIQKYSGSELTAKLRELAKRLKI